ncbi:DUF1845 domain-containing protein [Janthinobacterium sp.]|uniref:DUF1845 domain-containing protein n=1 Tax=Janthinobacterium sp. TaxID=1871054 RepID=UPI002634ED13|nr:DUF1845 domain-containing protein [Janthinobacterium sp.]
MNSPAPGHLIVKLDHGDTNRKLLAKEAAADFTRIESASRKIRITLASPEGKRLYLRCFYISQANFHFISVFARMKLQAEDVDKVEQELRSMLDARIAFVNQRIAAFEKTCHQNGIAELASYDIEPLSIEARVISMFGRRLLELISKVDQIMPMLETLCIDEALSTSQLISEKSQIKKTVRAMAATTRALSLGLVKRINALPAPERKMAPAMSPIHRNGATVILSTEVAPGADLQSEALQAISGAQNGIVNQDAPSADLAAVETLP